jgi:hypothetical protein
MNKFRSIKLYARDGSEIVTHDTEDKSHWCKQGIDQEKAFVETYGTSLGYAINPKKSDDDYVPDLVSLTTGNLADLKSQHRPFFKAYDKWGYNPTFTVVFNVKDRKRYELEYPDIDIIYFIDWEAVKASIYGKFYYVEPLTGVYKISFHDLLKILDNAPVHGYKNRKNINDGNAEESYVFQVFSPGFKKLV